MLVLVTTLRAVYTRASAKAIAGVVGGAPQAYDARPVLAENREAVALRRGTRIAMIAIAATGLFCLGFGAGGEYKRYKIRNTRAVLHAFSVSSASRSAFGSYHQQRIEFWRVYPADAKVVMIGDSLVESGLWPELLPNVSVANRGVAGDGSAAILTDLDVLLGRRCETVSLALGTNDFLFEKSTPDEAFQNWKNIVARLVERGIKVVATSTPMTVDPAVNAAIRTFNERVEAACRSGSCVFVDLNAAIAPDGMLDRRFTLDGVHLTVDGYRIWADLLRPHLRPADASRSGASRSISGGGSAQ